MDDFAIVRNGHGPRGVQRAADILLTDAALPSTDRRHAPAAQRGNMAASNADKRAADRVSSSSFGLLHGLTDRGRGLADVDNNAAAQSTRRRLPHGDNMNRIVAGQFADQYADFGRADINAGNQIAQRNSLSNGRSAYKGPLGHA